MKRLINSFIRLNASNATYSSLQKPKTGILMLNMGGPQKSEDSERFLTNLFSDPDIFPLIFQGFVGKLIAKSRAPKIEKQYNTIGGGSPITKWTKIQGESMVRLLDQISPESAPHKYYIGFRYVPPFVKESIEQMHSDGIERAVAFSQYPQFSCTTSGSSINELTDAIVKTNSQMVWSLIDRWPLQEHLIQAVAQHIQQEILSRVPEDLIHQTVILFSAHSLPISVTGRGDPYPHEVSATVQAVMQHLNYRWPHHLVWQSKVGFKRWLEPSTSDAMAHLKKNGYQSMVLVPIAFTSDHIETLYEMDIEYCQEVAHEHKIPHVYRVASLNDNPIFLRGLAEIVSNHLRSAMSSTVQYRQRCALCKNSRCEESRGLFRHQEPDIKQWHMNTFNVIETSKSDLKRAQRQFNKYE